MVWWRNKKYNFFFNCELLYLGTYKCSGLIFPGKFLFSGNTREGLPVVPGAMRTCWPWGVRIRR